MKNVMQKLLTIARSRKTRLAFNALSAAIATVVGVLLVQHFRTEGWPLSGAKVYGVIVASALFLLGYALKALGWRRLFAPDERPASMALAAAGGAASVTGIALPGRFDELVRVAVVRRYPGSCAGVGGVCLSLLLLGLIDSAALAPLAGISAGIVGTTGLFRAGLIVVAGRRDRSSRCRAPAADDGARRQALPFPARPLAPRPLHVSARGIEGLGARQPVVARPRRRALRAAGRARPRRFDPARTRLPLRIRGCGGTPDRARRRRDPGRRGCGDARRERRRSFAGSRLRGRGPGARDHDGRADPPRRGPLAGQPPPPAAPGF